MIVKAICMVHPADDVLLLEGTTSLMNGTGETVEIDERATMVRLDEANLYCTGDAKDVHDVRFKVIVAYDYADDV